jgi:type IV pilus modification protein PilV
MRVEVLKQNGRRAGYLQRAARHGFSLIEVLVAILILGVALVGLTRGITTALSSSKESEVQTTAAMIAASLVESMRVEGMLIDGETEGGFGGGLALYHWKESVTASQIDGLHDVKVVISNVKSGQTIYELQTLLFEPTADTFQKDKDKKGGKKKGRARG